MVHRYLLVMLVGFGLSLLVNVEDEVARAASSQVSKDDALSPIDPSMITAPPPLEGP